MQRKPVTGNGRRDERRWDIVRRRDRSARDDFVYAVRTTGVYCRPGCASRMPNRRNVVFFDLPREAEAEGYRACVRCRPGEPAAAERQAAAIERACRLIEEARTVPSIDRLAGAVGYSPSHFHRVFRRLVGVTPRRYAAARRSQRAGAALRRGATVTEAVGAAGYGSPSRLYEEVAVGLTPSAQRRGADGETIRFAVAPCEVGQVLVAATERGLCAVDLGDEAGPLLAGLRDRYPGARLERCDDVLGGWVRRIVEHLREPRGAIDLPLDIRGTAFQRRVWDALRALPPGATTTYGGLAASIGRPEATRAVAGARAANPLAVVIPCHRVLRRDGGAGGYRWGTARKRALLDREARASR